MKFGVKILGLLLAFALLAGCANNQKPDIGSAMDGGEGLAMNGGMETAGQGKGMGNMHGMDMSPPSDLDLSSNKASEQGLFQVSIQSDLEPLAINQIHSWTVHVEDASGKPVEGALISFAPEMPQHGHGMPTQPEVTEYLGSGDYKLDGMKFNMGGWWQFTFEVTANGQTDRIVFNRILETR